MAKQVLPRYWLDFRFQAPSQCMGEGVLALWAMHPLPHPTKSLMRDHDRFFHCMWVPPFQ
jgi:hypothetical protein